jgi:iron(III) transport system substrate-binding protein
MSCVEPAPLDSQPSVGAQRASRRTDADYGFTPDTPSRAALVLLALAFACGVACGAAPTETSTPVVFEGSDRLATIAAAARREGSLTLYTTIAEKDLATLVDPFEAKYGIEVEVWRAGTDRVLQRTVAEAAAGRYDVDVIHFGSPEMEALSREKILLPVTSPAHADLLPGSVPAHREWAATLLSVWVQAYNTTLVSKDRLPKTYSDLLDPQWSGRLGIEAKDQDWFAAVVDVMGGRETGLPFFQRLAAGGISVRLGHTLLTNMVVSGEVPLALTVYNYMPEQAKKKGAPIDWFALEPAIARSNAVGVARRAPHPNAALLFYEYLLSEEAQQYFVNMDYVPTNSKVASPLKGVAILQTDPVRTLDETDMWTSLFDDTVLSRTER